MCTECDKIELGYASGKFVIQLMLDNLKNFYIATKSEGYDVQYPYYITTDEFLAERKKSA